MNILLSETVLKTSCFESYLRWNKLFWHVIRFLSCCVICKSWIILFQEIDLTWIKTSNLLCWKLQVNNQLTHCIMTLTYLKNCVVIFLTFPSNHVHVIFKKRQKLELRNTSRHQLQCLPVLNFSPNTHTHYRLKNDVWWCLWDHISLECIFSYWSLSSSMVYNQPDFQHARKYWLELGRELLPHKLNNDHSTQL